MWNTRNTNFIFIGQADKGNRCFLTCFRNEDVNLSEMQNSIYEFIIAVYPHY